MVKFLTIVFCLISVSLVQSAPNINHEKSNRSNGVFSYMNDFKFLYKTYQECSKSDISTCLKLKLASSMGQVFRKLRNINIMSGISFVRDESVLDNDIPMKSEKEIEETLPRSLDEKDNILNGMIFKELVSFFKTHTLQIKFPSSEEYQRSMSEGRKKDKNSGSYVMIPLLLGGTFIPIAYGALALLAGKALIVSKLALVLASIIGIKKLLSGSHGGHHDQHEVVVSGGHGHSGWGRNYELQNMAYNAYAPK